MKKKKMDYTQKYFQSKMLFMNFHKKLWLFRSVPFKLSWTKSETRTEMQPHSER